MTLKAAIYARYSSDLQSIRSIEDQIALCRQHLEQKSWTETVVYSDRAISGGAMVTRPGIQELIRGAANGQFNVVVAEALDRISRDQADTATIYKILAFHGVSIVTLSEGEVDSMHVGFKGVMNEMFLRDLAKKTRRGQTGVVNSGRSAGGRCYGYDIVPGEQNGILTINEDEAETVRRIMRLFVEGTSPRSIASMLNQEGVAAPRGPDWRASTINGQVHAGNGILNNELYIGRRIWNRRHKVTDPFTGKKRMRANPESEWVINEVPDLRIVDDELWQAVKLRQQRHSRKRGGAKRPTRLLSGLLECSACGGPMSIVSQNRYGCSTRREKGTCSNNRTIAAKELEERVLAGLNNALLHPDAQKAAAREFHAELVRQQKATGSERFQLEKAIAEAGRRIDRIVDAIAEGIATTALKQKLVALEAEKIENEAKLAAMGSEPIVSVHPNAGELYAELIGSLVEVVSDPSPDADEVRSILRKTIQRICLEPRKNESGYNLVIKGDLAALISQDGQTTLMMGAGVGFEPTTFRL
jgi:site-specific DNA recombinase